MESGDSCTRLQMSCQFHGDCHSWILGKGFGELWIVGTTTRRIRTISSVSWPRFIHGWLWKLLEMLVEGKEGFPGVLGVLEKEVSVVRLFFFDNDSRGLWFGYGGWSGDHEKAYVQGCKFLTVVGASFSTMVLGRTIQVMSRQLQFVQLPEVSSALAVIHDQFLGDPSAVFEAARRDYLNMKCCSLNAKDLDFHYKRMSLLFYKLNGFNEPTLKHNSSDDSDSDQSQIIFHQQLLSLDTTIPILSIKLQILPSKFQRPIPAIGLIDTGAQRSMLNPHLLPPEDWTDYEEHFKAVNGKLFTTSLITKKPIGIQIFPNCVIWTKVIGSTLPNKDLLLGFDILHQIKHLQILPNGIRVKSMFKPFTDILKLYNLSETPQPYQDISNKLLSFCPESHSEFTHPNTLWKNKSFFIKLPFKFNEDINPTKATHPGMSPSDLLLAQQECSQLLAQGLIEPTNSQWACQAFYVEKHSEIIRGKKRLVIDYQPLNMFLQDDKFPLPRRQSMFTFLKNAQIFSKFDLKSGFCHGIMLSAKKSTIATDNIEFLGMIIKNGHYQPGPHIAQELLHFPDQHFSKRQVQQFLGIINYIRDFIPHVDHYTHHLSALLKKQPPEWNTDHTNAVTTLKQIAQNPPPLKLIIDGKRILQTDASDDSWGAILLEEINGKEHFIAYASGQFSDTQKHYHSIFKEILAVKHGIKKFEYHLIGHHFLIRMDSLAFPNILNFKDQVYEWFTTPHLAVIENEIQDVLHNYLCQLNHQPPPLKDIFHTSLGPQHDLLMIPTPSAISKLQSTGIIIKEEKPDYIDFLFQDSQDPWEAFLPLSQHLQQFPQPSMNEPGSSSQPPKADTTTKPSKVDKATQTSPRPGY
ncbi:hypothetical protein KPL71_017508 [Citrus sinensis]|uniref:Uncharacterized protein n=2 Tax=Citrus sinensis TaxID=2711 RepID=A0ACB8JRJ0_CITSI|nr:hypothetical protein KPL71_017508 [Citrus sinensis]